ncbi:MAG: hypothetical protein DI598_07745 [Pseudopedobacter saltans]|uniref:DNA2/NAM7 helicase-like C-terminal domain-containing protein n=1 Tax=Pseudopedobacter saltans TaxID=151895 RepID=A0A2W5F5A6_9SPHI|nr:MAG: hypothetical protein DI598_07745 [Pseudopedobacter saltans]
MQIGNLIGKIVDIGADFITIEQLQYDGMFIPTSVLIPELFQSSVQNALVGNIVQLIDVVLDDKRGCLLPKLLIIEPDYLVDVSAVAECMREYGSHPFYFLINRCTERVNSAPILLGNAANFFLDELVYSDDPLLVDANATIKKFFHLYPLDISICLDLKDRDKEIVFFDALKQHFNHLQSIVSAGFTEKGIDRKSAILEPSFICPSLGLQGRLDFFERRDNGASTVIELKSGKTPYGDYHHQAIGLNHQTQASLYQIMIQQALGISFAKLETYICYSRCGLEENPLRLAFPSMALIAEALNIRNHIALNDYKIAFDYLEAEHLFGQIRPEKMLKADFVDTILASQYIKPQVEKFSSLIDSATDIDKAYFFSHYQFLVREQWFGKCGIDDRKERSHSSLWRLSKDQKKMSGTLLDQLSLVEKQISKEYTIVVFNYDLSQDIVSDFREGDIVVLYPDKDTDSGATKHQVYKGSILSIGNGNLTLRLRNHHRESVLSGEGNYIVEHDFLDNNYAAQFRGLYKFLSTSSKRKSLILGLRKPETTQRPQLDLSNYSPTIQKLLQKVNHANELFLLVGPPGTGKTSLALRSIVQYSFEKSSENMIVAAYTNRAVDELCLALESIPNVEYVRLGSHVNCSKTFQKRLLSEQVKSCSNRNEVNTFLERQRIYVGTIAAFNANTEILSVKHFDRAIVDEASQILDPQLLSLFCSKNRQGKFTVDKFVLIGDYKQLPAVCLQGNTQFESDILLQNGIFSGQISFFERMLRMHMEDKDIVMQLESQGRMHPEIAYFANTKFYNSSLKAIPLTHQNVLLEWNGDSYEGVKQSIAKCRNFYFPIYFQEDAVREAERVVDIAKNVLELYQENSVEFVPEFSLGIITPFRNQVALIRKKINQLGNEKLNKVIVDTVERYQGSQRDIIIYAFGVYSKTQLQQVTDAVTVFGDLIVDRKLNVALTRARKQFFFVGSQYWCQQNSLYKELVEHLSKNGI